MMTLEDTIASLEEESAEKDQKIMELKSSLEGKNSSLNIHLQWYSTFIAIYVCTHTVYIHVSKVYVTIIYNYT